MKFQQGKHKKIKDFTDETSFKNIFTNYSIVISTGSTHKVAKIQSLWTKNHYTKFYQI